MLSSLPSLVGPNVGDRNGLYSIKVIFLIHDGCVRIELIVARRAGISLSTMVCRCERELSVLVVILSYPLEEKMAKGRCTFFLTITKNYSNLHLLLVLRDRHSIYLFRYFGHGGICFILVGDC